MRPAVVMYSKSWCPYCARARQLLTGKGVAVQEIDIEAQPERRDEMIARTGRRTVPQIFIGARHVGGCDDLHALDAAGSLDPLLGDGGPASSVSSV
ncbi:MAG: glutaredoxin 3 [Steroidobacteraceae bacterium]